MRELDDNELLREYVGRNSEEAFATLVARHINQVYSVALRHGGNPNQAEEITQAVFVILARKARSLRPDTILSAWLHQTARLTAVTLMRGEIRRARREHEAHMQTLSDQIEPDDVWRQLSPHLDGAISGLGARDRAAIVLRYFDGKSMKEVGAALSASEDAAKKRVDRAVEKLRLLLRKRGVVFPAAALVAAISAGSVQAAPSTLAASVSTLAAAKGATAGASTLTLIKGALKLMAWTQAKTAIVISLGALLVSGAATVLVVENQDASFDAYLQNPNLNDVSNAPPMVAIQPTHFATVYPIGRAGVILGRTAGTREIGRNIDLSTAILKAWRFPSLARIVFPADFGRLRVDYLVTVPDRPYEKFQEEIKRKFGWSAHVETRATDVLLLKLNHPGAPGLTPADGSSREEWLARHPETVGIHRHAITASQFADLIEGLVQKPLIDRTGLAGKYDFVTGPFGPDEINEAFLKQLGLELVPAREPIEMLVVEKAK